MNSKDIFNPSSHKLSAFNPVIKTESDPPSQSAPPSHQLDINQAVSQQNQRVMPERNLPSDENPSEDYYCMTCHQNFNIRITQCNHKMGKSSKYKCDFDDCNREFNIGSRLQRHKLVHTGAKPYQCDFDQCDQRFNQKSNLNRHRRIHTQEKPFICQKCCKSFTTTTNLKQHVQVHFEDKQKRKKYVCQIKGCNKQYLYMCNLKKHKQQHQDPLSDCIGQKRPDFPIFSLTIGHCLLKIIYKKSKDHSQVLFTFRDAEGAIKYEVSQFEKVLESINLSEQKPQMSNCMQEMQTAIDKLFENSRNAVNICFQMHPELSPVANLTVKAIMGAIGTLGAKVVTILMPSYSIFRDVIQNLLYQMQVEQSQ